MTSKRQQTMSKMTREREVRERRARKLEKKHAAAAERKARADGVPVPGMEGMSTLAGVTAPTVEETSTTLVDHPDDLELRPTSTPEQPQIA